MATFQHERKKRHRDVGTHDIRGKKCEFELDTEAALSIVPKDLYEKCFSSAPLMKSEVHLTTYTGEKVKTWGQISVDMEYEGKRYKDLPLIVVDNSWPPLFRRNWLENITLNWRQHDNTHLGLYRYTSLPHGISSAPSVFQSTMDKLLQGLT